MSTFEAPCYNVQYCAIYIDIDTSCILGRNTMYVIVSQYAFLSCMCFLFCQSCGWIINKQSIYKSDLGFDGIFIRVYETLGKHVTVHCRPIHSDYWDVWCCSVVRLLVCVVVWLSATWKNWVGDTSVRWRRCTRLWIAQSANSQTLQRSLLSRCLSRLSPNVKWHDMLTFKALYKCLSFNRMTTYSESLIA